MSVYFNSRGGSSSQPRRRLINVKTGHFMHLGGDCQTDREELAWFGFPEQAWALIEAKGLDETEWRLVRRSQWTPRAIVQQSGSAPFI